MYEHTSRAGYARRIDVMLRARYPHLQTRLFEVVKDTFQIVFASNLLDADSISEEFDNSIRFLTVNVTLSNTPPNAFIREITLLSDEDAIGNMIGLPLRRIDLVNLLASRFPDAGVVDVQEKPDNHSVSIVVKNDLPEKDKANLLKFTDELSLPIVFTIEVSSGQHSNIKSMVNDPMFIWASRLRPHAPSYTRLDEEFWFDNIHNIAANKLPVDRFPGMRKDAFRCYLDLSLGEQHINLRQALLLYDEVWCSLPLRENHESFLTKQGLTEEDLLTAVGLDRLRFVTTQPEERLSLPFLERVFEREPTAMFGRRTTAALLVADLVQTADISFLNDTSVVRAIVELARMVAEEEDVPLQKILRGFLWPLASCRDGLQGLLDRGSKAGPAMGLAELLSTQIQAKTSSDVALETLLFSEQVHIVHALNGTLFGPLAEPQSFIQLKHCIGRHLNFHRNFNEECAALWLKNEKSLVSGREMLPTVPLFEFDSSIPIQELLEDSDLVSTRFRGRGLYARLAKLSPNERKSEVEQLNQLLRVKAKKQSGYNVVLDSADVVFFVLNLIIGLFVPPVSAIGRFSKPMIERARRNERIDSMVMKLEDKMRKSPESGELDFLSRVSRVASFKVERVRGPSFFNVSKLIAFCTISGMPSEISLKRRSSWNLSKSRIARFMFCTLSSAKTLTCTDYS